jgi:hypothetical protein
MKKSLLSLILSLFLFGHSFAQWKKAKLPASNAILSLAVDYSTSYVYAGSEGNGVYISADTGATWKTANTGLPANLNVSNILIQNKNIFLATNDGVYKSANNGNSWQQAGLKGVLVKSLTCYIVDTVYLYTGTEKGIYLSKNNGVSWSLFAFPDTGINAVLSLGENIFYAGMTAGGLKYYEDYRKIWAVADTGITTKTIVKFISAGSHVSIGGNSNDRPIIGTDQGVYFEKSTGNWVQEKNGMGSDTIVNSVLGNADMGNQGYTSWIYNSLFIGTGKDPGNVYYRNQYPTGGFYWSALNTGIDGKVNALAMYRNIVFAGGSSLWILKSDMKYLYVSYQGKLMQATGDTTTIKILPSEFWWISASNDWLTFSQNQGTGDATITVTASPNNTGSMRFGFVYIDGQIGSPLDFYQPAANTTTIYNEVNSNVTIYPIPVKDDLVISVPNQSDNSRYSIYNLSGMELLASQLTGNTTKINMSGFMPGVYVLKIYSGNTCTTQKIIKQ